MLHQIYSNLSLNPETVRRKDDTWLKKQQKNPNTQVVICQKQQILIQNKNQLPLLTDIDPEKKIFKNLIFLGTQSLQKTSSMFPIFICTNEKEKQQLSSQLSKDKQADFEFQDIRKTIHTIPSEIVSLITFSLGLSTWYNDNYFCSTCSTILESNKDSYLSKNCPLCKKNIFPRINPAVIMLVENTTTDKPQCLLVHHDRLVKNMYSTVAGFVELGETLEQTVAREVKEEVGLNIHKTKYIGSQSWTFSSSLMIGYIATTNDFDFQLDYNEINKAQWFSVDDLLQFSQKQTPFANYKLSRPDSIARQLIETWIAQYT